MALAARLKSLAYGDESRSTSLRKLLARVPICDVNVHTDGFPFDPKD